ncbi:exosortase K [Alkaliphilus serpentinus]|uniref:Exosortase K n=1 Tax=Alkaliphilus serpentinus TaxID=1482731 RepID=A0A833HQ53_9FIRM|nr:exosortase K [Alkaliphilus serpentinus]KAB3531539.1 exosortase K [Alkaliphilus serpentinus]
MNIFIYIISFIVIAVTQYLYLYGKLEGLLFILKPVVYLVSLFTGEGFTYYSEMGFLNPKLAVNIGRECAGINFFSIVLLMLIFSNIKRVKGRGSKLIFLLSSMIFSYLVAIIVNASRIIASLFLLDLKIFPNGYEALVHQATGIIFFLGYLFAIQFLFKKIICKMGDHYDEII